LEARRGKSECGPVERVSGHQENKTAVSLDTDIDLAYRVIFFGLLGGPKFTS
jgi:hypothetical protein